MSHRPSRRDVFRCATWLRAWVCVSAVLFLASLLVRFEEPWKHHLAIGLAAFACLGVVDTFVTRVSLMDGEIVVVKLFRRKRYARGIIEDVTWSRGGPVSLKLNNGTWASLPATGPTQRVVGAIRAWLNEGKQGAVEQADAADKGR